MTFEEYLDYFHAIVQGDPAQRNPPYDSSDYYNYTRMNWSRMNRWLKTGVLSDDLTLRVKSITEHQTWLVITEPWCGDAAHSVPFIHLLSQLNPSITVQYELRDSSPFRINEYLTKGAKSIPKVIFRNRQGLDIGIWGPRPVQCQALYERMTAENATIEAVKIEIQKWYNEDKGVSLQEELLALLM